MQHVGPPGKEDSSPASGRAASTHPAAVSPLQKLPPQERAAVPKGMSLPWQPITGQHGGISAYFLCNMEHLRGPFRDSTGSTEASTKTESQLNSSSAQTHSLPLSPLPRASIPTLLLESASQSTHTLAQANGPTM